MAASERQTVRGVVVSAKMDKTIVVKSEWRVQHPQYKKYVRRHSKFYAHDENNEAYPGDTVEIRATRPLSKLKRWRLVSVLQAAPRDEAAIRSEAGQS